MFLQLFSPQIWEHAQSCPPELSPTFYGHLLSAFGFLVQALGNKDVPNPGAGREGGSYQVAVKMKL